MSTQHSQKKNIMKKIKLAEVDKNVCSIAEYKRLAILKYCKENGIKENELDVLSISNELHRLGLCYSFCMSIAGLTTFFF